MRRLGRPGVNSCRSGRLADNEERFGSKALKGVWTGPKWSNIRLCGAITSSPQGAC